MTDRTINKIISKSPNLQESLLDLTSDSVSPENLLLNETAHNREGEGIIGKLQEGGTSDYDALSNRPQINGNLLTGNKTGSQLGLQNRVLASTLNIGGQTIGNVEGALSALNESKSDLVNGKVPVNELPVYTPVIGSIQSIGGVVPPSSSGDEDKYLRSDGTWAKPAGGGGGVSDYDDLTNRPKVNGTTLSGDKTGTQLGLQNIVLSSALSIGGQTITEVEPALHALNNKSGGGGHTILDEDGITYPQRSKLQFEGAIVSDDETNNATVVETVNPVEYEEDKEDLQNQLTDQTNVLGAKNLIPYPYSQTTKTASGITFTDNGDGTVTVNGTATADVYMTLFSQGGTNFILPKGSYKGSGCPSGGSDSTYQIRFQRVSSNTYIYKDKGNGVNFEFPEAQQCGVYIFIYSGATLSNVTFKPMLRLASDPDNTYVPYAMTNRELTEVKLDSSVVGVDENGAIAEVAHEYGTHFVKNGKYCRAIDYIGIGGTFSLGTNYIEETITKAYDTKYITSSTDLNTLFNPGYYMWASSKPINTPDSVTYCIMRVIVSAGASRIQIIYCGAKMYQRIYTSQGWQSWYKFTGTVVS